MNNYVSCLFYLEAFLRGNKFRKISIKGHLGVEALIKEERGYLNS
jgi:hypothetical protein